MEPIPHLYVWVQLHLIADRIQQKEQRVEDYVTVSWEDEIKELRQLAGELESKYRAAFLLP